MTKVIEAIFEDGVLTPLEPLELPERQRVRVTVEAINGNSPTDREAAMLRLRAGIAAMNFRLNGPLPSRDELHER